MVLEAARVSQLRRVSAVRRLRLLWTTGKVFVRNGEDFVLDE